MMAGVEEWAELCPEMASELVESLFPLLSDLHDAGSVENLGGDNVVFEVPLEYIAGDKPGCESCTGDGRYRPGELSR